MDFDPDPQSDRDPSQVIPLRKAWRDFLEYKKQTQKESTARAYKFPTRDFIEHVEKCGVTKTGNLSKRHVTLWTNAATR